MTSNNHLLAQGTGITNPLLSPKLQGTSGMDFFSQAVPKFVGLGLLVGVIIFFFMFLIGAIKWISSGGDKQAVESAQGTLSNAIIGLIVMFSIFAIVTVFEKFFGVDILKLDLGVLIIS